MRLVTFRSSRGEGIGALHGEADVLDFAADPRLPTDIQTFIEGGDEALASARALLRGARGRMLTPLGEVELRAPLPRPVRLRDCCLFLEHIERGHAKMGAPFPAEYRRQIIYYNASHLHIYGPDADVPWPAASDWIDYEFEWACVVGRGGTGIARADARSHIFGFTIFNDWSARDLQFPFMQAGLGPGGGKDFANSLGPCIATADEFDDPYALAMTGLVNGEPWSSGTTATMAYTFEDAICQFSRDQPLLAGEVLGSGTVLSGCGFDQDRRLAIGDRVELRIDGLGVLRNRVVRA